MTIPSPTPPSRYRRRIVWLGICVLILIGAYSAAWFWLARQIETRTEVAFSALSGEGRRAECANPTARGYPFRIGLFCDRVSFADASGGIDISTAGFRSAGQIYDPMRLVAELDGPATIQVRGAPPLAVDWDILRASTRLAQPLPSRISLEGKALRVATKAGPALFGAAAFEGHMRPREQDVDLAGGFDGLVVDTALLPDRKLPLLSGSADVTITNGVERIARGEQSLRGLSLNLRSLQLSSGAAGLSLSGPFAVDADGLVDANLTIAMRDPDALAAILADAAPEARQTIASGFAGFAALGQNPTFPLKIAKGNMTLGFLPLGKVPPLED